jgi:epoxyqueuosine reductase QueG
VLGARAAYPFGDKIWPFQRWAARAEGLHASPLGLLIHPEYGLWHAYRAALFFAEALDLPVVRPAANPCETCARPCLSACPAGAFTPAGYELAACASHLASDAALCRTGGCHARDACPVGRNWRYPEAQIRFHMAAFARSVAALPAVAPVPR